MSVDYEKELELLNSKLEAQNEIIKEANESRNNASKKINEVKKQILEQTKIKSEIDQVLNPYKQAIEKINEDWNELDYFLKAMSVEIKDIEKSEIDEIEAIIGDVKKEHEIDKKEDDITEKREYEKAKQNYEKKVEFLKMKEGVYNKLKNRKSEINSNLDELRILKILVEEENGKRQKNNKFIWFLIKDMKVLMNETKDKKTTDESFKQELYTAMSELAKAKSDLDSEATSMKRAEDEWKSKKVELDNKKKDLRELVTIKVIGKRKC